MFHRHIRFSLLSATFLLGSSSLLFAMEKAPEEDERCSITCTAIIPYQSPEDILWPSQRRLKILTYEDHDSFELIESFKNPIPQTNSDLDEIQPRLQAPLVAELPLGKYLFLKNLSDRWDGFNPTLFVGVLENGTKVFIKKTVDIVDEETHSIFRRYKGAEAIPELVAPRVARAYFDAPTLPPTELIQGKNGQYELRQYFIDDALPEDLEDKELEKLARALYLHPEVFNRPVGFIDSFILETVFLYNLDDRSEKNINGQIQKILYLLEKTPKECGPPHLFKSQLTLFNEFYAADDRNVTNLLLIPPSENRKKWTFFSIDYQETYDYNPETGQIVNNSDNEDEKSDQVKTFAFLSALRKLGYLSRIYRSFFKEAEALAPEHYDENYFAAMTKYQNELLSSFHGRAIDDLNYVSSTLVNSHRFNILTIKNSLPNLIRGLPCFRTLRKAHAHLSQD
ncbi:MAG: hypothetical protein BGO67_04620 [Alphaproteobacteria bacterium 41-28]|nr:MAG: hypothetical protein BGO67_04620 [Alphaproteobacteria bacterium 41-28]